MTGKATDVIYLDICKAFDMIPNHILISKSERFVQWKPVTSSIL